MTQPQTPEIYQLKITLVDSEPEVWRRLQVPAQIALEEMHDIVQSAMGWENQHEYVFRQGLGEPPCSLQQRLTDIVCTGKPLYYTYDFQSGWLHRIEIEDLTLEEAVLIGASALPRCIEGESACPPEASGGVWGYEDFLYRLENTEDPEYMDLIGKYGDFDPCKFDVSAANSRLANR